MSVVVAHQEICDLQRISPEFAGRLDLISVYRTNKVFSTTSFEINSVKLKVYSIERALFEVLHFERKPSLLTSEVIHNYPNTHKYKPAAIHRLPKSLAIADLNLQA